MNPNPPSSSLWAAAAQNSIGARPQNGPATGIAPGAFSAIVPSRSFADIANSSSGRSVFDAPSGSNDFDMSGLESEAAVLGGGFGQSAFGAPRPATNAFGAPTSSFGQPAASPFAQPSTNAFGQPSQPLTNAFGQPSQPSTNAFGQPSQPNTSAFGQPSTNTFNQPATSAFGQAKQSAFGPGGMGMPAIQSAFGPGGMGAPSATPSPSSAPSAFGTGGMGPPSSASMTFGRPAQSTFGQPQAPPPMTFGAPAQSTFGQPKPSPFAQPTSTFGQAAQLSAFRPAPSAAGFGAPVATPSPNPSFAAFGSPAPAVSPAPAPAFGMPSAPTNNAFGSPAAPAATSTPASAPNPPKEVTDAFFKNVFAKKPETPATPPSAAAITSTTPQNTPPPAPIFGKAAPPVAPPATTTPSGSSYAQAASPRAGASTQPQAKPSFSDLLNKAGTPPASSTPKAEDPASVTATPSTPAKEKAPAQPSTTPAGVPPASRPKEEAKPAQDFSNALAAFAMKKQEASSVTAGFSTFSIGSKKSDDAGAKNEEKEKKEKAEASKEAEGKSAEAFKAFRAQDPFDRFKQPQQSSWLDAPREKAEWEIKLEESKKKAEAAGSKPAFDNSAFTTAQLEERRKQRAEEHQLEHDDSDDEEQDEDKEEEKFPEDKLTSKEPTIPKTEKSAAAPITEGAKLNSNLLGLSVKSSGSKASSPPVDLKAPWRSAEDDSEEPPKEKPSTSPEAPATSRSKTPTAAASVTNAARPEQAASQVGSTTGPVKSTPLAPPPVAGIKSSPASKPASASLSFNLTKKPEVPSKLAAPTTISTASKLSVPAPKPSVQPPTPAATFPSLGRLSSSESFKKEAIAPPKPVLSTKPAFVGGWPDEPVPKFCLATSASSDSKVESTSRELEKARMAIDEGLRQIRATVEDCRVYQGQLKTPSPNTKGIEHITEAKRWNFADFGALNSVVNEVQAGTAPLKDKDVQYRRMSVEIDSLVLKAETKKEECARFKRAHNDKDYASVMRIRQLGPEQSENQTRLRHSSLVVHNQLERLEDYVVAMRATVIQKKSGSKPLTGPIMDTINRTIRNLDTTAATELATLDSLIKRLRVVRDAYRAQLPIPSSIAEDHGIGLIEPSIPAARSLSGGKYAPSSIASARLKAAFLTTRTTPVLNTMARQFTAGGDFTLLDTDLSLAIHNGPLTLDMSPPKNEEPAKPVKVEGSLQQPPKQVEPAKVEEGVPVSDPSKPPTAPGLFNFSGPLPAGWEAFKNAPYKPLVIEPPPRPSKSRHGHRHAAGERSALTGRESHLKQAEQPADAALPKDAVSLDTPPVSGVGAASQTSSSMLSAASGATEKTGFPALSPLNAEAQKAPVWPSFAPVANTTVTPLGTIPLLPRKDFLASLPPVKKDSPDAPQLLKPANKAPSVFVPLLGKAAPGPTALELQEKAKQAWGSLGAPKTSAPIPSLSWRPPQPPPPMSSVATPAAAPQLPAAWKVALESQGKPTTPPALSQSPAGVTAKPAESQPAIMPVEQEATPYTPPVAAAPRAPTASVIAAPVPSKPITSAGPEAQPTKAATDEHSQTSTSQGISFHKPPQADLKTPSAGSSPIKSPATVSPVPQSPEGNPASSKAFDFSALTKAVEQSTGPTASPSAEGTTKPPAHQPAIAAKAFDFSALTKAAQVVDNSTKGVQDDGSKSPQPDTKAFDFSSFTKNAAAGPKPVGVPSFSELLKKSGVSLSSASPAARVSPQAPNNYVALEAPKTPPPVASPSPSLRGARSPPLQAMFSSKPSSASKSAFGAGGFGMPASTPSAPASSAFGPGGIGAPAPSTPGASTAFRSAFGPGGMGTPAASEGNTTPPSAKSPSPAPIGGTFGMHSGGASGTFGTTAAPPRSIFAKPEGWTPPTDSTITGSNIFRPVTVPASSGVSGNVNWAKQLAEQHDSDEEEEEEDENVEGEEDDTYDNYQHDVDYGTEARDLSDLEEADEEYEVVDE
ncbi:hypothetical protein CALCODRAFT_496778 [Calocera cornea HHB12733]|uniref:Uncharacterized protein n=1 Tax=Calocera cornea HHB12733 TaxID=1353952 RepID=A0A165FMC2_9BASI|nr:hypothetical protein CALCODRAFT_496778 [Calocera cornea HHB12733]